MQIDSQKIIKIIEGEQTQIDLDALNPQADLRDIGADSLDMMSIFLAVQEEFDVEIPDEEIENLTSVNEICTFINRS